MAYSLQYIRKNRANKNRAMTHCSYGTPLAVVVQEPCQAQVVQFLQGGVGIYPASARPVPSVPPPLGSLQEPCQVGVQMDVKTDGGHFFG